MSQEAELMADMVELGWTPPEERQRVAVIDFDGVIAEYDGWRGPDVFGAPIPGVREALQEFKRKRWLVIIWTTREATPRLLDYLAFHDLPYDGINTSEHNPPGCSSKPIADVYLDDRSWQDVNRKWNWKRVMKHIRREFPVYDGPISMT